MARRLAELDRRERDRKIALAIVRILIVWVVLFTTYYLVPLEEVSGDDPVVLVGTALVVFGAVVGWSISRVLKADLPALRAVEALGFTIPLFLCLFAIVYLVLDRQEPASFSESLDRIDALYFAITVFATVGFGDITPDTSTSRTVVSLQMLLNLVVLGVVVRVVIGAARLGIKSGGNDGPGDSSGEGS